MSWTHVNTWMNRIMMIHSIHSLCILTGAYSNINLTFRAPVAAESHYKGSLFKRTIWRSSLRQILVFTPFHILVALSHSPYFGFTLYANWLYIIWNIYFHYSSYTTLPILLMTSNPWLGHYWDSTPVDSALLWTLASTLRQVNRRKVQEYGSDIWYDHE